MKKNKQEEFNILITSVGRRSYLVNYFKEALNGMGKVHVSNSDSLSPAFLVADATVVTPLIYDSRYIDFILDYALKNNIKAIISLFDIDLPILSKNKYRFEAHNIKLIVSDERVTDICNDKYKTFKFLNEHGFKTPKTFVDINKVLLELEAGKLHFPLIIKPRWGMGSIGVNIAESVEELKIFYKKTRRTIFQSYLEYESSSNIEESIVIQEMIHGQEYGLDIINDLNCNYQNTVVKLKYAMRAGETDSAVTVNHEKLKLLGSQISMHLKHIANLDVDVFVDGEEVYVLEMNARFGGGYPFSHAAGVNLPKAIVCWLNGEVVEKDLLQEKFDLMFQKDIVLVPIELKK